MNRKLKWTILIVATLFVIGFLGFRVLKQQTKQLSPEDTVTYKTATHDIEIYYNRPSKRDRVIFGELVPYGEVWRTGANEPTTFTTRRNMMIDGKPIGVGTYTLWTIPNKSEWTVIFNTGSYGWGVSWGGKAARNPELDALTITVPAYISSNVHEMFTISIEEDPLRMRMMWVNTVVDVPLE